jgi:alkanesulfonate monooxygenase SsuD/methylene tetrahydromethanopterin reductase-like flavin-dependent oxidoreductase (luciferase family)
MATAAFGVRLPVAGPLANANAIRRAARAAEDLGFDAVWVHDFIVWTRLQDRTHISSGSREVVDEDTVPVFHESLTNLAFLAGITTRVRLGVAVLCLPYRQPVIAARQIANIDVLSGGRLILGVGQGGGKTGNNKDFEVLGIERVDKYARTADHLRAMLNIWTEEKSRYQGPYAAFPRSDYAPQQIEFFPKPDQKPHPPIWMGGWSDRGLDLVAEFSTGWLPSWITPEDYPARVQGIRERMAGKGRADAPLTVGNEIMASIAETTDAAVEKSRRTFAVLSEGFQTNPPEEQIRAASLCGDPDHVGETVGRYVDGGVDHFELKFIYHSIDHLIEQMELFATRVIPSFATNGNT